MHEHEVEINEVASEQDTPNERLQEGVVGDAAGVVGALAGTGSLAWQIAHGRACGEAAPPHEPEGAPVPADMEYRDALYRAGGLEAIDAYDYRDVEYHPGPADPILDGDANDFVDLRVEDDGFDGFGVE